MPTSVTEESTKTQARRETETLTREEYLQVNRKHLIFISFEINYD
jgi:hypothetical protein